MIYALWCKLFHKEWHLYTGVWSNEPTEKVSKCHICKREWKETFGSRIV